MITLADLEAAIAECVGERDPNANTCIKLAAFYTIRNELYPAAPTEQERGYSFAPAPTAEPTPDRNTAHIEGSSSEFARTVEGLPQDFVWGAMDELMEAVMISQPALYKAVLRKLQSA